MAEHRRPPPRTERSIVDMALDELVELLDEPYSHEGPAPERARPAETLPGARGSALDSLRASAGRAAGLQLAVPLVRTMEICDPIWDISPETAEHACLAIQEVFWFPENAAEYHAMDSYMVICTAD